MRGGTVQINWHDTQPVLTLDFHPPTRLLATGGADHDIKLWVITSDEGQKKLPTVSYQNSLSYHSSAVNVLRFSPSGEHLASGADGGELVIWKLQSADDCHTWKVLKTLLFHRKDVLDLQWSADGAYMISGSVDNSCIIWDINKGSVHQILDAHLHYVQGVAWDPLGHYVASLSSDRTCRIYMNKPQAKLKGCEKMNYVCQHVLAKSELQKFDDSKPPAPKAHLLHDETLPSFFRRLAWSPDGSFLVVPAARVRVDYKTTKLELGLALARVRFVYTPNYALYGYRKIGIYRYSASEAVNTAYVISRRDLSKPSVQLPGASKPIVAVRFCPVLFCLRGSTPVGFFKLPYRVIFAVATLNSLYIYDTESVPPIAIYAGLHYAAITDIAWSPDARHLALSSRDGYCTVIEFENDELGKPASLSEEKKVTKGNEHPPNMKPDVVESMEIDNIDAGKAVIADRGTNTKANEGKQVLSNASKNSDANKPARKRITPIAIN